MSRQPLLHRRRGDRTTGSPLLFPDHRAVITYHGSDAECPDVQVGRVPRCLGHGSAFTELPPVLVAPEGPAEHCRNALALLRVSIEHDEPLIGNGCPAVAVPITTLARLQARLEAAIEQLDGPPLEALRRSGWVELLFALREDLRAMRRAGDVRGPAAITTVDEYLDELDAALEAVRPSGPPRDLASDLAEDR